ncbi:unnamed protein product, partial [Prunus brigantina]
KDRIALISLSLIPRVPLSLSSGSRPPPQPATFWPAVCYSGHQSRRGRYQNDRAAVLFLPQPGPAASCRGFAGKSKRKASFRSNLRRLRSPSSGRHFWRSRVELLALDLEVFRRCSIALDTHALPTHVAACGHLS